MKKIIVILGTVILGVYIVATLILGGEGSLKDSAKDINDKGVQSINQMLTDMKP